MRWTLGTKASSAQGRTCSECSGWGGRPGRAARGASRGPSRTERLAETLDSAPVARAGRKTVQSIHQSAGARDSPPAFSLSASCPQCDRWFPRSLGVFSARDLPSVAAQTGTWARGSTIRRSFLPRCQCRAPPSSFLSHSSPSSVALYPPPLHPDRSFPLSSTVDCR